MINVVYRISRTVPTEKLIQTKQEANNVSCKELANWIDTARHGEKFCYFTGKYLTGNYVGKMAWRAYEQGLVTLFQSKVNGQFQYWVQRIRR